MTTDTSASPTSTPLPAKPGIRWSGSGYVLLGYLLIAFARKNWLEPSFGHTAARFIGWMALYLMMIAFVFPKAQKANGVAPTLSKRAAEVTAPLAYSALLAAVATWLDSL